MKNVSAVVLGCSGLWQGGEAPQHDASNLEWQKAPRDDSDYGSEAKAKHAINPFARFALAPQLVGSARYLR